MFLLFLTVLATACATHTFTLNVPSTGSQQRNPYPHHVAVLPEKTFTPHYEIKYRWWSTGNFTLKMQGLQLSLVDVLRPHFVAVQLIHGDQTEGRRRYDLIAKMSVDRIDFNGARLAEFDDDDVDVTMTFMIERPDGTEVFRTTVSASASSPRSRGPNGIPPAAFSEAFNKVFKQLSETLKVMEIPDHSEMSIDDPVLIHGNGSS